MKRDVTKIKEVRLKTAISDLRGIAREMVRIADELEADGLSDGTARLVLSFGHRVNQAAVEMGKIEGTV